MDITVNRAAIYEAAEKLSNWARWGDDDQLGTLNLVTEDHVREAAGLIQKGKTFALGLPLDEKIKVHTVDFVIVRTGHQESCLAAEDWTGYGGGDAPGLAFETCYWIN